MTPEGFEAVPGGWRRLCRGDKRRRLHAAVFVRERSPTYPSRISSN